jgi:hypothetical protein
VNVPSVSKVISKILKKVIILLASSTPFEEEGRLRIHNPLVRKVYGAEDPYRYKNGTDPEPEHCRKSLMAINLACFCLGKAGQSAREEVRCAHFSLLYFWQTAFKTHFEKNLRSCLVPGIYLCSEGFLFLPCNN